MASVFLGEIISRAKAAPQVTDSGEVEDERRDNANRAHELVDILVIALCGMLSGADDWVSIAQYGREKEDWFRQFLALPNGIPSHDTFNRVFRFLDAEKFIACFSAWIDSRGEILGKQIVAVVGKTLSTQNSQPHFLNH